MGRTPRKSINRGKGYIRPLKGRPSGRTMMSVIRGRRMWAILFNHAGLPAKFD